MIVESKSEMHEKVPKRKNQDGVKYFVVKMLSKNDKKTKLVNLIKMLMSHSF